MHELGPGAKVKPFTLMRRIVDGLDPAPCVLCDGYGPPSPCYGGVRSGYTTCAKCYASDGPSNRDCFVAMVPDYIKASRRGMAPYFTVRRSFALVGKLVDGLSGKPSTRSAVRLVFPNGICFDTRTDSVGRFRIVVTSSEGGARRLVNLGVMKRGPGKDPYLIGFKFKKLPQRCALV